MTYAVRISLLDIGGFYPSAFPALGGTLLPLLPVGPADPGVPSPPMTLTFASPSSPPAGLCSMLVTETGAGDLFRSGIVSGPSMPLSTTPAPIEVVTFPSLTFPLATITALAGVGTTTVPISPAISATIGVLTLGFFAPTSATLTTAVAAGLVVTATGTLAYRLFGFIPLTATFTLTFTLGLRPSGDPNDRARVVAATATGATLSAGPWGLAGPVLAFILASAAAQLIESSANGTIAGGVGPALAGLGFRATPSSVVCARRVIVTASGVAFQLLLSDLFGSALEPIPAPAGPFKYTIAPQPRAGTLQTYQVRVTDLATGAPVPGVSVSIHNFNSSSQAVTVGPSLTDATGLVSFQVALHPRIIQRVVIGGPGGPTHERERVFISPTIRFEKTGYTTLVDALLTDPSEQ